MAASSQPVTLPATRHAIFLVVTLNLAEGSPAAARAICADLGGLVRAVGARDHQGALSCIVGVGSDAWTVLFGDPRPAELHPLAEIVSDSRHSVSTPGDLLFHIRAERMDLCFELAIQIVSRLDGAVSAVDEVHGFRYFDDRDLTGFVDGTENPVGQEAIDATTVGDEDAGFASGSYVLVQQYVHDLATWDALRTEEQERIIGRTKLSDIELAEEVKPSNSHSALTVIEEDGEEVAILRHNMPFGDASGASGTYFIGYARSPRVLVQMLENMFVGLPPGNYDRLLDFTHPVTGTLFFVPSATFLDGIA